MPVPLAPVEIVPVRPLTPPIWVAPLNAEVEMPVAFAPEAVIAPEEVTSIVFAAAPPLVVARMPKPKSPVLLVVPVVCTRTAPTVDTARMPALLASAAPVPVLWIVAPP